MMMIQFIKFFLILTTIDLAWLSFRKQYYADFYRGVQGSELKINMPYALLSYVVIALTLWYFIINKKMTVYEAMFLGASLYAVYDLTNQATLTNWTLEMTVTDIMWGAIVSGLSVYIYNKLTF